MKFMEALSKYEQLQKIIKKLVDIGNKKATIDCLDDKDLAIITRLVGTELDKITEAEIYIERE